MVVSLYYSFVGIICIKQENTANFPLSGKLAVLHYTPKLLDNHLTYQCKDNDP